MVKHVWPKDQFSLKVRVVSAFGLLLGSKVILYCTLWIVYLIGDKVELFQVTPT